MFRLSVIIPAVGLQSDLDDTLVSVLENQPIESEVLLVHHDGYRDPYDLGKEVRFVAVPATCSWVGMLEAGFRSSRGSIIHFLDSGCLACAGWTEPVIERFGQMSTLGAVIPLVVDIQSRIDPVTMAVAWTARGASRWLAGAEHCRRYLRMADVSVAPLLRSGFFRRRALEQVNGLSNRFGKALADAAVAVKLRRGGWSCDLESESCILGRPLAAPRGYLWGRNAERLYRQTTRGTARWSDAWTHAKVIGMEFLSRFPFPTAWTGLAGRAAAWLPAWGSARDDPDEPPTNTPCIADSESPPSAQPSQHHTMSQRHPLRVQPRLPHKPEHTKRRWRLAG